MQNVQRDNELAEEQSAGVRAAAEQPVCREVTQMRQAIADNGAMPLNTAFIRQRREQLGLTQQQAADAAGFPNPQKWSNYETGKIPDPQLSTLEAIARALRCKVAKIIR